MSKKVILGGTFDKLHLGHKELIDKGLELGDLTIGLVSDEMLKEWKPEVITSYDERKRILEDYLYGRGNWEIIKIDDPYHEAVKGDYDILVVSYETKKRGKEINEKREKEEKEPLKLVEVEPVLADDLLPISSTRIRNGDINDTGERIVPVKVHIGSNNDIKIKATKDVIDRFFDAEFVSSSKYDKEEQSFNEDIIKIATKKAIVPDGFDYGIGIESGIVTTGKRPFSVEYAVIKDKEGYESTGHGPGFPIPESWIDGFKKNVTLGNKMKVIFGENDEDMGAVGLLTEGKTSRKECIETALLTAMIPRLKREIYY